MMFNNYWKTGIYMEYNKNFSEKNNENIEIESRDFNAEHEKWMSFLAKRTGSASIDLNHRFQGSSNEEKTTTVKDILKTFSRGSVFIFTVVPDIFRSASAASGASRP